MLPSLACMDADRMQCQISTSSIFSWARSHSCFFHHFQPWCSIASTPSTWIARCQLLLAATQAGLTLLFMPSCNSSMVLSWISEIVMVLALGKAAILQYGLHFDFG